jgi:hypothetical protein
MVYVLPREGGYADCTASDLRWASDAVADADVAQMMAFLQQTPDVPDLLNRGDLCFIWLWERREGTERGIGAQCLDSALTELKKRFRSLKTVVVSLQPWQLQEQAASDTSPASARKMQSAAASLKHCLDRLRPERCFGADAQLCYIEVKERSGEDTMLQLGLADLFEKGRFDDL